MFSLSFSLTQSIVLALLYLCIPASSSKESFCACVRMHAPVCLCKRSRGCFGVLIALIMVDGRLWYCGKTCSMVTDLFYPEMEWKLNLCLSYGPLLQVFHPALRAHYIWITLIWRRDFSAQGRTWFLLAAKMLQGTPWRFVGIGNFSNRNILTVQMWGFQFSPACSSGSAASENELYTIFRLSIGHLSTICRKPIVMCESSICLWRLGADCPNGPLGIQGLQFEALSKEESV